MGKDGLTSRITTSGIPVLRVHYSADSNKDPQTPEGAQWYLEVIRGYAKGAQDPGFQKEMEMAYGAMGGQALFPLWSYYEPVVVIPPFNIAAEPTVKFYGTYDHGFIHKCAYHVHAVLPDGRKFTVWEFSAPQVPVRAIAEIIQGHEVKLVHDGRTFPGNPYAGKEVVKICDPHLFERRGSTDERDPHATVGDVFRDRYGVYFQKGHKGGQLMCASSLTGDLWLDPSAPKYLIFRTCTQLLWELPRLHYKTITSVQARSKGEPEQLVDKDNDAWDSLCHFLRLFPSVIAPRPAPKVYGTFSYWQNLVKTRAPLSKSYTRV